MRSLLMQMLLMCEGPVRVAGRAFVWQCGDGVVGPEFGHLGRFSQLIVA